MRTTCLFLLFLLSLVSASSQIERRQYDPTTLTTQPEAYSLFGKPLYRPDLPPLIKAKLDSEYVIANAKYNSDPNNADNIIWLGRRAAYLGRYREAIDIFTKGIEKFPKDPRMYRHRGHRYITIREFDKANTDLRQAFALSRDKPDEVEPDGQPNKSNVPTTTLFSNILYHWGLAIYFKGDFNRAVTPFDATSSSFMSDDMRCAGIYWKYMSIIRSGSPGLDRDALKALEPVQKKMKILENFAYHRLLLLYKGELPLDSLSNLKNKSDLDVATYGYGLGNWYHYNGQIEKARAMFEKIVATKNWAAFGYIAAEADLKRLESKKSPK